MTNLNTIQQVEKLVSQLADEDARKDTALMLSQLSNKGLVKEIEEFKLDYASLLSECEEAEAVVTDSNALTQRLMSASAAVESLTDDLCKAQESIGKLENESLSIAALQRQIADKNIEIKGLSVYKKKSEVLAKDLKAMEVNYQNARTKQVKPVKQVKVSHSQLQKQNDRLNKYISELVAYGNTAPQFMGGLKHSTNGVHDFIDCKPEKMSVREKGGKERELMIQRVVVINQHNSTKVMTRIIGEPGLHTCKIPTGGTVKIDDEIRDHVTEYFKTLDSMNAKLKQQKGTK